MWVAAAECALLLILLLAVLGNNRWVDRLWMLLEMRLNPAAKQSKPWHMCALRIGTIALTSAFAIPLSFFRT